MTRPSERELAKKIDELRDDSAETIYDWLVQHVLESLRTNDVEVTTGPTPVPDDEMVAYVATDGEQFGVPPEDLPAWIDEDDLPIHGTEDRRNPFVVADFTNVEHETRQPPRTGDRHRTAD
jgi:hypothetical protein